MREASINSDWRLEAKCRDENPDMFFPQGTNKEVAAANIEAKAFCIGCTVINECLENALTKKLSGVQGGTTKAERRKILKSRREMPADI